MIGKVINFFIDILSTKKALVLLAFLLVFGAIVTALRSAVDVEKQVTTSEKVKEASTKFNMAVRVAAPLGYSAKQLTLGSVFPQADIEKINKGSYAIEYKMLSEDKIATKLGLKINFLDQSRGDFESEGTFESFIENYSQLLNNSVEKNADKVKYEVVFSRSLPVKEFQEQEVSEVKLYDVLVNGTKLYQPGSISNVILYKASSSDSKFRILMMAFFPDIESQVYLRPFDTGHYNLQPLAPMDSSLADFIYFESPKFTARDFKIIDSTAKRVFAFDNKQGFVVPAVAKEAVTLNAVNTSNPNYLFISFSN